MAAILSIQKVEMQGMQKNLKSIKSQKTMNDRMIEELPPDALDPVTMEPLHQPLVTECFSIPISGL